MSELDFANTTQIYSKKFISYYFTCYLNIRTQFLNTIFQINKNIFVVVNLLKLFQIRIETSCVYLMQLNIINNKITFELIPSDKCNIINAIYLK